MTHRRIEESIGIRYSDLKVLPNMVEEIRILFERNPLIDPHQPIYVFLKNFGEFSVQIELRAYALSTRYQDFMELRQSILMDISGIIEKNGAMMPLPTMELFVNKRQS
jgi:MscS family membrane protein